MEEEEKEELLGAKNLKNCRTHLKVFFLFIYKRFTNIIFPKLKSAPKLTKINYQLTPGTDIL